MSARPVGLLAALLALLAFAAAPASAQETEGAKVEGGGDFGSAPLLKPGTFQDTLRPGETPYYAVEVGRGQVLKVTLRVVGDPTNDELGNSFIVGLKIFNPLRQSNVLDLEPSEFGEATEVTTVTYESPRVGAEGSDELSEPGRYWFTAAFDSGSAPSRDRDYPIELDVAVEGDALPDPTATAPPTEEQPEPEPADELEEDSGSASGTGLTGTQTSGGGSVAVALVTAFGSSLLIGALLGIGGGLLLRGVLRPRAAPPTAPSAD